MEVRRNIHSLPITPVRATSAAASLSVTIFEMRCPSGLRVNARTLPYAGHRAATRLKMND